MRRETERVMNVGSLQRQTCLIGFGANLGDPAEQLRVVGDFLLGQQRVAAGVMDVQVSQPIWTAAVGGPIGQRPYMNAAIRLETTWPPADVSGMLFELEHQAGRRRNQRWAARPLDLDLLLYGDWVTDVELATRTVHLPHPRMSFRRFVLTPAAEIGAELIHPVSGKKIEELLSIIDHPQKNILIATSTAQRLSELQRPDRWSAASARGLTFVTADRFEEKLATAPSDTGMIVVTADAAFFREQAAKFSLVVYFVDETVSSGEQKVFFDREPTLADLARGFQGPTLPIYPDPVGIDCVQVLQSELEAAIDAMK